MAVADRLRVAVLMGGTSTEHDVSICSGLNVVDAVDRQRFEPVPVYIDRGGRWHFDFRPPAPSLATVPGQRSSLATDDEPVRLPTAVGGTGAFERLQADGEFDVAFIALHGPGGEDGAVQGMLSLAGVPFTGSGVLSSALAMDKSLSKRLYHLVGVPGAADLTIERKQLQLDGELARLTRRIESGVGFPCVVKPVAGGSSFGTGIAQTASELEPALRGALIDDSRALVEAHLAGSEVTCGVLGGGCEPALALPVTEIVPDGDDFFDFHAKYTVGACREITPARIDGATTGWVQQLALTAHEVLGCEGMSRSDFIVTADGPVILETNTVPGLTSTSLLPQGAAAAGISFEQLLERLIDSALLRAAAATR